MHIRSLTILILSAILIQATTSPAMADNKRNNKNSAQEKKDDARVKAEQADLQRVRQELERDEKHLREMQKDLAEAQAKLKAAGRAEQDSRTSIEAKQERIVGIDQALAIQEEARKAYEAAAAPVLEIGRAHV